MSLVCQFNALSTPLQHLPLPLLPKIAGPNAPISNIEGSPISNVYNLDLNDAGDVIFRSVGLNDIATFTIINGVASKITNGEIIAINDEGTVVFDNGGNNIFVNSNGVTTSLVDSSGPLSSVQSPVINDNDTTVFAGRLDTYTDPSLWLRHFHWLEPCHR